MDFTVIVPYRPVDKYREANAERAFAFWAQWRNVRDVVLVDHDPYREFSRARSFNRGVALAPRSIEGLILADVDVIPSKGALRAAMHMVEEDPTKVVQPFDLVYFLKEDGSLDWHTSDNWSMVHVLTRETYDLAGGHDDRFVGWGFEDNAFAARLGRIGRSIERLRGTAHHYYHPQVWRFEDEAYLRNKALWEEYL